MTPVTAWIDSHCHLDAPEFGADGQAVRERARQAGVRLCVIPAVAAAHFENVRSLAHSGGDGYALGIHPLFVGRAADTDLARLDAALLQHRDDPHLLAVGEIGLDFLVPELKLSPLRERQEFFYHAQLKLARQHGLPVILHVRRSADRLLKYLRELAPPGGWRGIAHAFNGSQQQAEAFIGLGLKLGFGGAVTFAAARQIRQLAASLPLDALVLETDAPDMPPIGFTKPHQRGQQALRKGATSRPSCRGSRRCWPSCAASARTTWRWPARQMPCWPCRVCRACWREC
jgi:TatD DNase family protein